MNKKEIDYKSLYKQVKWERDIAINQLKELGYGLGEKITDKDQHIFNAGYNKGWIDSANCFLNLVCHETNETTKALYPGCIYTEWCDNIIPFPRKENK